MSTAPTLRQRRTLTRTIRPLATALPLALALLAACGNATAPSRTGTLVSDLHFNPLADTSLQAQLEAAPVAQWDAILAGSTPAIFSGAPHDTNFFLLQSALTEMKARVPSPDVVFLTGDLLVHGLALYYRGADLAGFAAKSQQYLAWKLSQTFPQAQILATMGDWDQVQIPTYQADPAFLASFAAAWGPLANRHGEAPALEPTFTSGGYFSTAFPIDPKGRLLVLYTQPWAAECTSGCTTDAESSGAAEIAWLTAQLADARAKGERVWLLGHIPPGIGAPPTATALAGGTSCQAAVSPYYAEPFATQLLSLYQQYGDLIGFGLFAHQHTDDFRVMRDPSGRPLFGMKLVPSISPMHGNDPAFVRFTYDPAAGSMTDATTVRLTNIASATAAVPGVWADEYSFDETYGQVAFDSVGVADAVARIEAGWSERASYITYYPSSNPAGNPPAPGFEPFTAYACALDNLSVADFTACFCPN